MAACKDSTTPFSLELYHVSEELGFILPEPLQKLPPYYQPWMDIAHQVPELVLAHELRSRVNKMPQLSTQFLQKHRELRLAHLALSVMTMGYVWQESENDTVEMLPCTLAVPFWEVSQRLGLPPIITHADAVLANWRKKDPEGPFDMENLELLLSLPGGESVRGFFIVTLMVEIAAIPALRNIPKVINGARCGDSKAVATALEEISQSIDSMAVRLKLMQVHVDPSVFYGIMRIFLSGWKDNPCMPKGLVYEGVQTEPMEYSGGSAAQSSLLHCFDELLGVKHEDKSGAFLTRMRNYMLPAHKQLIQDISLQPSLRTFVQEQANEHLTEAFQKCVAKLLALRSYHITIVTRFITIPAAKARQLRNQSRDSEAEIISKAPTALEERGTGGTGMMSFLKTVRNQTRDALLPKTRKEMEHHS
ncbi:indoleamine 2,3-dioxygenase 1 [Dunckerocampus dactyliophorus]|uniref:indoleamine 2,3-dioxygenase 1 n=1 Tax=Dunckerocampus dactyliophorus TaxID=161453 RepID=UPI00240653CE|nr:indoleamine 2,3-dioxygenase 1 [Dunckerocampus dactyliophorus]XP_054629629.1 indoleamine 2,3-dioxygenase 1 [Dunckerocampus dactyliophorus]